MNLIRLAADGMAMDGNGYLTMLMNLSLPVLMVVLLYFFMIRPQKKRDKEEREMRNSIQVGYQITTFGGFSGKVVRIMDYFLTIETSNDRTKLRVYRWAIRGKEASPNDKVEAPKE